MEAVVTLLCTTFQTAQAQTNNGTSFTLGYGVSQLLGTVNQNLGGTGITSESLLGPYHFKIEKTLASHVSLGLSTSLMRNTFTSAPKSLGSEIGGLTSGASAEAKRWAYSAVGRLNFHLGNSSKFDPYFGGGIGYSSATWSGSTTEFDGLNKILGTSRVAYELSAGAKYFLLPNLGVYAEVGAGGPSWLQGGFIFNIPTGSGNGSGSGKGNPTVGGSGGNTGRSGGAIGGRKGAKISGSGSVGKRG